MTMLRYVSHPNVTIDPAVEVPRWSLSDLGRRRVQAMLGQPWLDSVSRILTSDETKAVETAELVGNHLHLAVEVRPELGEIDRSSTGFVAHLRHEDLADRLFAEPAVSADGWERAIDAQARMVDGLADILTPPDVDPGDVLVVGHGGVGTLLLCHLGEASISRSHDQPGQGHYWSFDRATRRIAHRWVPIDDIAEPVDGDVAT